MFTDEKIKRIEKRLGALERATGGNFERVEEAFGAFRDVLLKMHHENETLRKDRDFLLAAYKMELKKIQAPSLRSDIKKTLVDGAGKKMRENFDLVRAVAAEGFGEPRAGELFGLVFENGKIKSRDASKRLGVHEKQVEAWARLLEERNLIETHRFKDQLVLRKRA